MCSPSSSTSFADPVPELPEVETTRRGIEPHLLGVLFTEAIIRRRDLRQPIPLSIDSIIGQKVTAVRRRSKYLIIDLDDGGSLLIHLGMSGSLRVIDPAADWKTHDHVGLTLASGRQLRYHDPRRFGIVLHLPCGDPLTHPLLENLGPEPLDEHFTVATLLKAFERKSTPIKVAIMDAKTVVGVGNIYASESLFRAGILPETPANTLTKPRLTKLVKCIRSVLQDSITAGGTTLRDFLNSDGQPGYFRQELFVYERKAQPCRACATLIQHKVMAQRSTYWCPKCQSH
jgi:formamidopyrimidine-DNA glycosylase